MLMLGLDTSTAACTAALVEEERIIAEYTINDRKAHSRRLLPIIASLLQDAGIEGSALDALAVSIGPGSFTGLRIGLATAKGLALAWSKPVLGVPSLDVLASSLPAVPHLICPSLQARKGEVYWALYKWGEAKGRHERPPLLRLTDYVASDLDDFLAGLAANREKAGGEDLKVVLLGDAVPLYWPAVAARFGEQVRQAPPAWFYPRASSLAFLALERLARGEISLDQGAPLKPLYIRPAPAAEAAVRQGR